MILSFPLARKMFQFARLSLACSWIQQAVQKVADQDSLRSKPKCARIIEARAISMNEFELLLITLPPEYLIH
jgi:hypothetical protein